MKHRRYLEINALASSAGASGWSLVRECRHVVIDFYFPMGAIRQVLSSTASDRRAIHNVRAALRRAISQAQI